MSLKNIFTAILLFNAFLKITSASFINCDPGTDVLRNDVVLTDIAFELTNVAVPTESTFDMDIRYYPEQVIPYDYRSSVYLFVTGKDGATWNDVSNCGMEFGFGSGSTGPHSTYEGGINRDCLTETGDVNTWPKSYEGDLEYWYCIGETSSGTCDEVDALTAGFQPNDRNSLRPEHYCKKTVYDFKLNVSSGGLDATAQFVMEYIRDPIEAPVGPFFGANGAVQALTNPVNWAVCDINDLGDVQYEECFARASVNPPPRVLDLSTVRETNVFSTVYALDGATDTSLVSDAQPLTINIDDSNIFLFHAAYAGDYSVCDPLTCTDATAALLPSLVVREYGDADVLQNYHVALEGDMPVFDEASTQDCDLGFCTLVLVLNFQSVPAEGLPFVEEPTRRQLFIPMPLELQSPKLSQYRRLEEDATQIKPTKVTATRYGSTEEGGNDDVWMYVVAGCVGFVVVGAVVGKVAVSKKNQEDEEEQQAKASSLTISSGASSQDLV